MIKRNVRFSLALFWGVLLLGCALWAETISFYEDFEKGLSKWDLINSHRAGIVDSGQGEHGKVLALRSGGPGVYALIKDSKDWSDYQVEGQVYFTSHSLHYMGFIYHYNENDTRVDFGSIFLLGPFGDEFQNYYRNYRSFADNPPDHFTGNVVLVNPHRDSNASRLLYTETWVHLTGENAAPPGKWQTFKAQVLGNTCHFYVGDMKVPLITHDFFEFSSGRVGFKPRFVGSEIRLDNIKVTGIKELSYKGENKPKRANYKPQQLITNWDALGPFSRPHKEVETTAYAGDKEYSQDGWNHRWQKFATDGRGCVVSGRLTERFNGRWIAYYHTVIESPQAGSATLEFSTTNPLNIFVNNKLASKISHQFVCWHDFWENPDHMGQKIIIDLNKGKNHVIVRVNGGRYGGDGFYARCTINKELEEE